MGIGFCLVALAARSDPLSRPDPFSSAWSVSADGKAQMRLIADTPRGHGHYTAAVEIKLAGQAITYWRTPGEAGVPPAFSFKGSANLAAAEVAYPAPVRINEQGLTALGYRGGVVFPVTVTARDPAKPVRLRLALNYAVCANICLPAKGVAELDLPQHGASAEEGAIAASRAQVPVQLTGDSVAKDVVIASDPAALQPRWILTWKGAAPVDLFAETPDGWDIATQKLDASRFALVADQLPPGRFPQRVTPALTLTTAHGAYRFTVDLDVPARASAGTK